MSCLLKTLLNIILISHDIITQKLSNFTKFILKRTNTDTVHSNPAMSNTIKFDLSLRPIITIRDPLRDFPTKTGNLSVSTIPLNSKSQLFARFKTAAFSAEAVEGSLPKIGVDSDSFVSVELQLICSESQFDSVVAEAHKLNQAVVFLWMAKWCRKCIYLKPKLEKLAADYYPGLRFYYVDVNTVPHQLVARAGVTKMPSIQLWKDMKKQAEVIGGHKAYLVINEVRELIENEYS